MVGDAHRMEGACRRLLLFMCVSAEGGDSHCEREHTDRETSVNCLVRIDISNTLAHQNKNLCHVVGGCPPPKNFSRETGGHHVWEILLHMVIVFLFVIYDADRNACENRSTPNKIHSQHSGAGSATNNRHNHRRTSVTTTITLMGGEWRSARIVYI